MLRNISTRAMILYTKKFLCNFQVAFVVGMCLGIQLLLTNYHTSHNTELAVGEELYYWKNSLKIPFSSYVKGLLYKLTILPKSRDRKICSGSAFELHNIGGLPVRHVGLYQTLGSTNVHAISGHVDDRLSDQKFIRLLAIGLNPGAQLYCNYNCESSPANICSVPAYSVILLAGNGSDYAPVESRKSLMDVLAFSCPVQQHDDPVQVMLAHDQCGFSHNLLSLNQLTFQGVMAPMWDVGICVRPYNMAGHYEEGNSRNFAMWLEYLRLLGADHVNLYTTNISETLQKVIEFYQNETFRLLTITNWTVVAEQTEAIVSDEAAMNHCLYTNMMKYRYVLVTSHDQWPAFGTKFHNLKQLVRSGSFESAIDENGGFRLSSNIGSKVNLFVKPQLIMNLAANHFIPLSGKPTFKQLDQNDISFVPFSDRRNIFPFKIAEPQLDALISTKLSRAGIVN